MFEDGYYTEAFQGYGFETYADFLELAARFGIDDAKARALMRPFVVVQPQVEDLVERSFLSEAAKTDDLLRYRDRITALAIGADGR